MPQQDNLVKEDLSIAYVMAISAKCGFSVEIRRRDGNGVDLSIHNKGKLTPESTKFEGQNNVQLKSTINCNKISSDIFSYPLNVKNYNELIKTDLIVPRILILLCLPRDHNEWLTISSEELILRKCCYWLSLKGKEFSNNSDTVAVHIKENQILNVENLINLMINVQMEQDL